MLAPAHAADWAPLAGAGSVDQYFYDRSKLTIKDEEITYWKKVVFQVPQSINGREVVSGLLRERIHCGEHTAKLVSYLYYSASGDTVEYVPKDESEASPIIPDTVGDAFERALCPKVWQKQEEARIKAEQKAAEAELAAAKREAAKAAIAQPAAPQAPTVTPPEAPAVAPPRPSATIQKAPDKAKSGGANPRAGAAAQTGADRPASAPAPLPMPQIVPDLPTPQLMEQLY